MGELAWRIYYGDGSTYSDEDGLPERAPTLDVQCIVEVDTNPANSLRRGLVRGFDFYWFQDGEWFGSDIFGLWDYLARPGWKRVLFGRTIATAEHQRIIDRALAEWDGRA